MRIKQGCRHNFVSSQEMLTFKKDRAGQALTLFTSANLEINGRVIAHCRVIISGHFDKIRGVDSRWVG